MGLPRAITGSPGVRIVAGHFVPAGDFGGASRHEPIGQTIEADGVRLRIDAAVAARTIQAATSCSIASAALPPMAKPRPIAAPATGSAFPWREAGAPMGIISTRPEVTIACIGTAEVRWSRSVIGRGPRGRTAPICRISQACVRALRADYCGSGHSHGGFGTGLALYDRLGIRPLQGAAGMSFEAAWGENGASCVNHMRPPARMTLRNLGIECANLPKARLGSSCDERGPALIFTKSPASPAG